MVPPKCGLALLMEIRNKAEARQWASAFQVKHSWPFRPQRNMKMEYRQGLKFKIPNLKSQIPNPKFQTMFGI